MFDAPGIAMLNILQPMVSLMNRLRYTAKFTIMGFLLLMAVTILTYQLTSLGLSNVNFIKKEMLGSNYLSELVPFLADLENYRRLVVINPQAIPPLQEQIENKIKKVSAVDDALNADLDTSKGWNKIIEAWGNIKAYHKQGINAQEQYNLQTNAIKQVLDLIIHVADSSNLTLDPDIDSYYLMDNTTVKLPSFVDSISSTTALLALSAKMSAANREEIVIARSVLQLDYPTALENYGKIINYNSKLKPYYLATLPEITSGIGAYVALINQASQEKTVNQTLLQNISSSGEELLAKITSLHAASLKNMETVIHARITSHLSRLYINLGIALLCVILLFYSTLGIYLSVKQYINDLNKTLGQLEVAKEQAAAANRTKSAFLANMSHELRTPLNAIIGYGEMLTEDAESQNLSYFVEDLKRITKAGKHLLGLINDVLDISKIEAGKIELFLEDMEVSSILADIKTLIQPLIEKKSNTFLLQGSEEVGALVMHTDITRLRQCLINLIGNAAKFTENGTITLGVTTSERDGKQWIHFKVSDTGIGMTEEQLGKLFQAFSQADASTTRKFGGTGLGLYISKFFATLLGGDIKVESTLNVGSAFTMSIPLRSAEPSKKAEEAKRTSSEVSAAMPKLLVIDDDDKYHELVERTFKDKFQLYHAKDGKQGLALAKQHLPDIISLDIIMPGMDGWSVLASLRDEPELMGIPVIMVSFTDNKKLGYALGVSDFLTKPVDTKILMQTVSKHVGTGPNSVLVVDDDESMRQMLNRLLSKAGFQVVEAANGVEALACVEKSIPSLILLDLMMPEMDGFEFVNRLHQNKDWTEIPVIVLTAKDLTEKERNRLTGMVSGLMSKGSSDRKTLLDVIHKKLDSFTKNKEQEASSGKK